MKNAIYRLIESENGGYDITLDSDCSMEEKRLIQEINNLKNKMAIQEQKIYQLEKMMDSAKNETQTRDETQLPVTTIRASIKKFYIVVQSFHDFNSAQSFVTNHSDKTLAITQSITLGNWFHVVLPPYTSCLEASRASIMYQKTTFPLCWYVIGSYFENK
ncbi:MAG: hypothetical protein KJ941_05165 [Bacteroidetes bacterium]|nr:hypothetical protein [Bacteroidota bacterium]